jgi:hypothetical protein
MANFGTPPSGPTVTPDEPDVAGMPDEADPGLVDALSQPTRPGKVVSREAPEPDEKRAALVKSITSMIKQAKTHWDKTFRKMEMHQKFAAGIQWPQETKIEAFNDDKNDLYIANITLRHIQQRVAVTYAKNPKAVAKRRHRLLATVWDGSMQTLSQATAILQQADQAQKMIQAGVMMGLASAASGVPISAIPLALGARGAPGIVPTEPGTSSGVAAAAAGVPGGDGGPSSPGPGLPPGGPPGAPAPGGSPMPGMPQSPLPGHLPPHGMPPPNGQMMPPPPGIPSPGGAPPDATASMGPPGPGPGPAPSPLGQNPMIPGMPNMPDPQMIADATAIVQDAQSVKATIDQLNKIGKTLELLYEYEIDEQQQPFKSMMKMTVRRAATSGVGWIKLGFQRVMQPSPNKDSRIADIQAQLELTRRISADLADDDADLDDAEAEQLRLTMASISKEQDVVIREGLMFSWPKPTAIIPDPRVIQLRDFLGASWVAEEYCLTPNEVQETYGVDVESSYTSYTRTDTGTDYERAYVEWQSGIKGADDAGISKGDSGNCLVWEFYNKRDGLVYVLCDGWKDFLREPAAPETYTDRFWPWFLVAFNECDGTAYPQSDVNLVKPMQLELNRSRQGLREHRFANRPKTAYAEGALSPEDVQAFQTHPVNALIAVSGLQPGQDINQLISGVKGVPVDPNLYEVNPIFQDLLRVIGDQQTDLGGMSNSTATETNIAASAKADAQGSASDDLDDTLTALARAASQILLLNVSADTVKEIVGPGAVWPELTKAQVAKDIYLDVEAGSSGRPNQAQELQNFERLAPILMQIPGITPTWMAKQAIGRLDDDIDVSEAVSDGAPSILQMNGVQPGMSQAPGGPNPALQGAAGPQGATGAPGPPAPSPSAPSVMQAQPSQNGLPN